MAHIRPSIELNSPTKASSLTAREAEEANSTQTLLHSITNPPSLPGHLPALPISSKHQIPPPQIPNDPYVEQANKDEEGQPESNQSATWKEPELERKSDHHKSFSSKPSSDALSHRSVIYYDEDEGDGEDESESDIPKKHAAFSLVRHLTISFGTPPTDQNSNLRQ